MARCKACGAEIVWLKLKSGKMHPCDAETVLYKVDAGPDRIVTPDGEVVAGTIVTELKTQKEGIIRRGYSSHFATCPFADDFRRDKK